MRRRHRHGRARAPRAQENLRVNGDSRRRYGAGAHSGQEKAENPLFHRLLHEAGKTSGLPVLYNTSFNLFGDPLDAIDAARRRCGVSIRRGIDVLFVGNFFA